MPVAIIALLLVLDDSVLTKWHLDLAVGHVQSQEGDGSSSCDMEDEPFGRFGIDIKREVRPETHENKNKVPLMFMNEYTAG